MDIPSMSILKATVLITIIAFSLSFPTFIAQAQSGFPLTVPDDFGRSVTINSSPKRIVSTAPSNTELLFALGAGDLVMGVTRYCDWPPVVVDKVKRNEIALIGGYADPSLEAVVSLTPDLVLAATDLQFEFVSTLQKRGMVVIALNPKNLDGIIRNIALVGTICGKASAADKLIDNLQRRSSYITNRVTAASSKPKVYYELWYDPLMSFGSNTLADELITKAGGENIFRDSPTMYPIVNSEMVIQKNPDMIVVPEGYMGGVAKTDFEKRAGWKTIKAVKEGEIYTINENLVIRPGPRICDGLENFASIIHPELFTGTIHYNSSIAVTSNSTVFAMTFDDSRSLLNFTVIGRGGSKASIRVEIPQRLIKGNPIVLVNGIEKAASISKSQEVYVLDFTTSLSTLNIVIGGTQTIPEFKDLLMPLLLPLLAALAVLKLRINRTSTGRKFENYTAEAECA